MTATTASAEEELVEFVAQYRDDPFGFVMTAYPWGEPRTQLEAYAGPDEWQAELLKEIGHEVRRRGFDGLDCRGADPPGDLERSRHREVHDVRVARELDHVDAAEFAGHDHVKHLRAALD